MTTMKETMEKIATKGYKIDVGSTSNIEKHYEISGKIVQIIVSSFMGKKAVTPLTAWQCGDRFIAEGNFGTPQLVNNGNLTEVLTSGLKKFNIDVMLSEDCEWSSLERIARFITKEGVEVELI